MFDLVIRGGLVATATDAVVTDLGITAGRIAAVAAGLPANWRGIDGQLQSTAGRGQLVLRERTPG